jgi:hypothetical protein
MEGPNTGPQAGQDYPRNWNGFLDWFGTEAACLSYLERLRWPHGFICPVCAVVAEPYRASRGRLVCTACRHQASVTAGTIFEKTVRHQPEARRQCAGLAAGSGPG